MRIVFCNLIFIGMMLSGELFAKTIALNMSEDQTGNSYKEKLSQIEVGDMLQFSNGKTYKILAPPKSGDSALIFQSCDPDKPNQLRALRIPLSIEKSEFIGTMRSSTYTLVRTGVRVPTLIESQANEYILHEWVDFEYSLVELLNDANIRFRRQALNDLRKFAVSTAYLSFIGDFAPKQLVYVVKPNGTNEWVLLDWTGARDLANPHPQFRDVFEGSFSSSLGRESVAIVQELRAIIAQERKERAIDVPISSSQRERERVQKEFIENRRSRFESRSGGRDAGCRDLFGRTRDF